MLTQSGDSVAGVAQSGAARWQVIGTYARPHVTLVLMPTYPPPPYLDTLRYAGTALGHTMTMGSGASTIVFDKVAGD